MRVVVDTNIFISAALKNISLPSEAARLAEARDVILKSAQTEQELLITLARPRLAPLIPEHLRLWLADLMAEAELIAITEAIVACRDPKDDKFLELAVSGRADVIVSGDGDLLALHPFRGIPIITPAGFVQTSGV